DVSVFVRDVECGVKTAFLAESAMERAQDCYYYLFDPDIPGEDNPGTFHSVDLWFFFETLAKCSRPFVGRHYDLARQMCNYWANFIKTGDPNGKDADGSDLPLWEKYTKDHRGQIVFTKDGAKNKVGDESYSIFQMQQVMEREDSGQLIYGKRGFL
ncbi:MAG TPA: carboxylesterase family protein, partial [Lachnospiraceae bacterium]|nr:carboxylesterase family protein [Lachnospiraceae bacterium]